jgi:hypothetical protein
VEKVGRTGLEQGAKPSGKSHIPETGDAQSDARGALARLLATLDGLPLTPEEKAEAVRRLLLDQREGGEQ